MNEQKEDEYVKEKIKELEEIFYSLQIAILDVNRAIVDLNRRLTLMEEKCRTKKDINPYGFSFID